MTVSTTGLRKARFSPRFAPSFVRPAVWTNPTLWRTNDIPKQEKLVRASGETVGVA